MFDIQADGKEHFLVWPFKMTIKYSLDLICKTTIFINANKYPWEFAY